MSMKAVEKRKGKMWNGKLLYSEIVTVFQAGEEG